jgi:hypothetical protein
MPIDRFSYRLDPYRANYKALNSTSESRWESFAGVNSAIVCISLTPLLILSVDSTQSELSFSFFELSFFSQTYCTTPVCDILFRILFFPHVYELRLTSSMHSLLHSLPFCFLFFKVNLKTPPPSGGGQNSPLGG